MAAIKDDTGLMTVLAPPTRASSDPVMAGEPFRIGEQVGRLPAVEGVMT
jgi:hypothetical protein